MIFRCQPSFETLLEKELAERGFTSNERGEGWVRTAGEGPLEKLLSTGDGGGASGLDLCFAHAALLAPVEIKGESVNALASGIADCFFTSARDERFEGSWPLVVEIAGGLEGLGRRADGVEKALGEVLKKRMARVAKLATPDKPRGMARARGLYVFFADFGRVFVSRECVFGGQRRMADDSLAPSRSYLKIEEAYVVFGREPELDDTVADLGAAPGGWSYSAAKRGARVVAVDNGPLKDGALGHALIDHRREDAFNFRPGQGERFDWMFCDLLEEPHHVMKNIVEPWLVHGWCRRFVVVLKFGYVDAIGVLRELRAPGGILATHATRVRIRHLYHNREEYTLVGEVTRGPAGQPDAGGE